MKNKQEVLEKLADVWSDLGDLSQNPESGHTLEDIQKLVLEIRDLVETS